MLELKNISKYYGKRRALEDVSFCVCENQAVGLLGENGAGKSTLLKIIAGCLEPDSGKVFIENISMEKNPKEAKHNIGFLPERPPLYPEMTVSEYLSFCISLKGVIKSQTKSHLEEVLFITQLESAAARKISNLSHGFKQRVGFAAALCALPKVILLDEPTNGMDPKQIVAFKKTLRMLSKQHIVILSSHILSVIQSTCERVIILGQGKIMTDQSVSESSQSGFMVSLDAPKNKTMAYLRLLPSVSKIYSSGKSPDRTDVLVETIDPESFPKELFKLASGKQIPILRLQKAENTLESLYVDTIKQGGMTT